jgi:hypothetical protein
MVVESAEESRRRSLGGGGVGVPVLFLSQRHYRTEGDSFCFEVVPGNPDESYSHVVIRYDNEITWWSSINLPQQSPDGTTIELTVIFLFLTCWQFFSFSS